MALFGPRRVRCPAGVWTVVIDQAFVQLPRSFDLRVAGTDGPVAGTLEERGSRWIFPGAPRCVPLAAAMTVDRGYFNTFYRVRVRPTRDVVVVVE